MYMLRSQNKQKICQYQMQNILNIMLKHINI